MEDKHIASALVQKRASLTGLILDLEERLRQARQDLVHIDVSIRMFDPDLDFRKISHKRPSTRGNLFVHGEIAGFCRNVLREASEPIAAEAIAIHAMQTKGLDIADTQLRLKVVRSALWSLRELRKVRQVQKIGDGLGARRRLPTAPFV
jgi:hypothetical protein